jgi:hypothetical protein
MVLDRVRSAIRGAARLIGVGGASPIKRDEQVVLFPVSASRRPDGAWTVPLHAWVFEPREWSKLADPDSEIFRALAMALGVGDLGQRSADFIDRARWFAVDNERGKEVVVALGRESWTIEETAANGHSFTEVVSRADAAEGATLPLVVRLPAGDPRTFTGEVRFVPPAGVSVISDIDDTIKISDVLDKRELIANTLLRPYRAVTGMPERYAELRRGGCFFHYVSASPWQLWPSLEPFIASHYPKGTVWLRHFRLKDSSFRDFLLKSSKDFKRAAIKAIFDRYPGHTFILVGDSGENDPEVFGEMFSDRVERILVRKVPGSDLSDRRLHEAFQRVPSHVWELID